MTVEQFMQETANLYDSAHFGKIYDIVSRKLDESTNYKLAHPKKVDGYEQYINKYPLELAHLFPGGEVKAGIEDYDLRIQYQRRIDAIDRYIGRRRVEEGKKKRRGLKRSWYLDKHDDYTYFFNEKRLDPFYLGYKISKKYGRKGCRVYSIDTNQMLFEQDSIYDAIFYLPYARNRAIANARSEFKQLYERGLAGDPASIESECHYASQLSYNDRDYALATCEKPGELTFAVCFSKVYGYIDVKVVASSEVGNKPQLVAIADLLPYRVAKQLKVDVQEGSSIRAKLLNYQRDYNNYKDLMEEAAADVAKWKEVLKKWNSKADDVLTETFNQYEEVRKRLSQS
jgi:hypothetical protein